MKIISSVKQCEGPGGILEKCLLTNSLFLNYSKDKQFYHLYIQDNNHEYTKYIHDKFSHTYNELEMEFGSVMPPKIKIKHKYFDKFIQLVENLDPEILEADPFSG